MTDQNTIQPFLNNFRRRFVRYLGKGIGAFIKVIPSEAGGAVVEVRLGGDRSNTDEIAEAVPTVNDALQLIEQSAFGGNIAGFNFQGTNLILDPARIVLIKADDSSELWTDEASEDDVSRIIKAVTKTPETEMAS